MRIFIVSPSYPTSKTIDFVFVDQLCRAFADKGLEVIVIAPQSLTKCLIRKIPISRVHSFYKTENGSGGGRFKSTISDINVTHHRYYIRAYATNQYGTSYGEVIIQENVNPFNLPIVDVDGYGNLVYMVLPYDLAAKTWEDALTASDNLVAYGYDDWFLPTVSIYEHMYMKTNELGSLQNKQYWTCETAGCDYTTWECFAYVYNFGNGSAAKDDVFSMNPSRPIRKCQF